MKTFEIRSLWDRSMARQLGESRSDETCIKELCMLDAADEETKYRKYSSMIVEHFDMLCCEFGAWTPDYERGENSLLNLA